MTNLPSPAYLTNRTDPFGGDSDLLGGIGQAMPAHLSINMNQFTLVDAAGNKRAGELQIDLCIIASNPNSSRIYFDPARKYDPSGNDNAPPLCWSDNGVGPSRNAAVPQSATCAMCPNAVWGSAVSQMTGRGVPACQQGKKIAFLVPGDADNILYMFKIPPASLGNLRTYIKTLAGNMIGGRQVKASDVVTRLSFESQGVIKFTPVAVIDEDMFQRTEAYYGEPQLIAQITGRDDVARDPKLPLPKGGIDAPQQLQPQEQPPRAQPSIRQQALNTIVPPQEVSAPKKRGPKPKTEPAMEDIPTFLDRRPKAGTPQGTGTEPVNLGPGMVQAPAPSNEISAALDNIFNLPGLK